MKNRAIFTAFIFAILFSFLGCVSATVPEANFTANVTNTSALSSVQFNDTSTGDATSWEWDFGDGSNSTEQHPTHIYNKTGNFTVSLNASNIDGSNKITRTNCVEVVSSAISNYNNVYIHIANNVSFDTNNNNTYYVQALSASGGGFNAIHITNSTDSISGQYTFTSNQSGYFFASDTGGRGYQDDVILMFALQGFIPDNFAVHITVSGYQWTPTGAQNEAPSLSAITYNLVSLNQTFTKSDFIYGLQNWKPTGGDANYPIYDGQDMNDTSNMFYLLFIDTHAGLLGTNYPGYTALINNGMVKIEYSFENLASFAAFNIYAWNWNTSQGQGMLWTNRILPTSSGGSSGYGVYGIPAPIANFTSNMVNGTSPLTIKFTDTSVGIKPLSYEWDFNNDGVVDSTDANPTYTYTTAGTYTVRLKVSNAYGINEIIKTDYILVSDLDIRAPDVSSNLTGGYYNCDQTIELNATDDNDPNPHIYYTLNGTEPTSNSTLYNGPIIINSEGITVLKFTAIDSSGNVAPITTQTYILDKTLPLVTINPSGGTYNTTQNIILNMTDVNPLAIYYTIDGSDPRIESFNRTRYLEPIAIYNNTTLKFAAVDLAGNWSPLFSEEYVMVDEQSPVVSADLPSGYYEGDQVVNLIAIDELDPAPAIYYTINGTDPTTNSTLYDWAIGINTIGTTILKFIAVDNAGHISDMITMTYYLDKASAGGTWISQVLDSDIAYNSIDVDSWGYLHIVYYQSALADGDCPELKYAYQDSTGWHIKTIDQSLSGSGYYVSLALDSLNRPHIAYKQIFGENETNKLKYAYMGADGNFTIIILAQGYSGNTLGDDISYINLVLYQDQARISYYNETSGIIEYLYQNGTNWILEHVNPKTVGGKYNSLAIDSSGNPIISFYDTVSGPKQGSLRIARRNSDGTWIVQRVYDDVNAGSWNSLAIDSSGKPLIAFIAGSLTGGSLKYAYYNGTNWIIETVDSLKALSCKLIIDPAGTPRIVYRDVTTGNLKYAYKEGSGWVKNYVDSIDGAGPWISLTSSTAGTFVSYMSANSKLKYASLVPFNSSATPKGGTYSGIKTVTLSYTSGTTLYYTLDGSDPRTSSTRVKYTGSITIKNTVTLKFAAVDNAGNWNSVHTETYIIVDSTAPTARVNINGGLYKTSKVIRISMSENGTIYYTTNGSTPTRSSRKYTGAFTIRSTTTLKFIAVDLAGNVSPVYTQKYTIDRTAPKIIATYPKKWAKRASRTSTIYIKFSEKIKASINWSKIYVKNKYGEKIKIRKWIKYNKLYIKTKKRARYSYYTVYIPSYAIRDYAGNRRTYKYVFKFRTGSY